MKKRNINDLEETFMNIGLPLPFIIDNFGKKKPMIYAQPVTNRFLLKMQVSIINLRCKTTSGHHYNFIAILSGSLNNILYDIYFFVQFN